VQRSWHRIARFDPPPGRGGFACLGDSRVAAGQAKLALVVAGKHVAFIRRGSPSSIALSWSRPPKMQGG